jgi:uncharacterized membrane protein
MITLQWVYGLAGAVFAAFALLGLRDGEPRRFRNGAFWGLMAASMWGGDRFGDFGNGLLVLALVGIGALGLGRSDAGDVAPDTRAERAARHGNRLFLIALVIPLTALAGTLLFKQLPTLVDSKQATLISLALGVLLALAAGGALLRAPLALSLHQGRRLMDQVGWAAILPQMLASLGAVFALAGVGEAVGGSSALAFRRAACLARWWPSAWGWRCSPWSWAMPSRRSR